MDWMTAMAKMDDLAGAFPQARRIEMASGETILVADDDAAILQLLELMLDDAGYRVLKASDGQEALDQAKAHRIDLALLDFMMPNVDGCTVCQHLKSGEGTRRLPVVIMSADRQVVQKAAEVRADDYILKPFSIEQILDCVQSCLESSTLQDGPNSLN